MMKMWLYILFLCLSDQYSCFGLSISLENIACGKPANQTGQWSGLFADKAVDGLYVTPGSSGNCAHPNTGNDNTYAEWWVDLEDNYMVKFVNIYNTYDSHGSSYLTYFVVSVSNSSTEAADCGGVYTDVVPAGEQVTIQCGHVGYYVHFRRVGGPQIQYVTLCEVEVFGHKIIDPTLPSVPLITNSPSIGPTPPNVSPTTSIPNIDLKKEILELTEQLIDSITHGDYDSYKELVDPDFTSFLPETVGYLVNGRRFHKFYFEANHANVLGIDNDPMNTTILNPHVYILGDDAAYIAYVLLIQYVDHDNGTKHSEETRIWQRKGAKWQNIHVHSSGDSCMTIV